MSDKIDKEIGKQKFKAKRQYIVEVEFEGEAYDKESFEELIPSELSVKDYDDIGDKSNVITLEYERWWHQPTEKDWSGKTIQLDVTEKIGECIPEEYEDDDGEQKLDYTDGKWTNDSWEYLKNEDGTDIKGKE
tara:strand:- start:1992 stop:2390 length:399 start_codon:yes stop_codon:yes gene_type:complete